MPECLISGDLRNSFFKVVRSSSESRLYLSWNALQNSSVNCCTLSPGDCMAFWTSRISSSAGVVSGALSLSFSWVLRMSCRMASHVLCVTWQKKSSSCICPASKIFQIAVCGGFGMDFQYHSPHSGQSGVHIVKAHGRHPIHINFRVCQQLRKFVMGERSHTAAGY